jgi:hypothetical protein
MGTFKKKTKQKRTLLYTLRLIYFLLGTQIGQFGQLSHLSNTIKNGNLKNSLNRGLNLS